MDFEWDTAKERANRKKHGIYFRTASKVFWDSYAVEFDDLGSSSELRFNAVGAGRRSDADRHLYGEGSRRPYYFCKRRRAA
jgi:uncharacterized DUF497 family protein